MSYMQQSIEKGYHKSSKPNNCLSRRWVQMFDRSHHLWMTQHRYNTTQTGLRKRNNQPELCWLSKSEHWRPYILCLTEYWCKAMWCFRCHISHQLRPLSNVAFALIATIYFPILRWWMHSLLSFGSLRDDFARTTELTINELRNKFKCWSAGRLIAWWRCKNWSNNNELRNKKNRTR